MANDIHNRVGKKRRLTEEELKQLHDIMANAPQGKKPTIRQLARYFNVGRPSIIKSLGGWKGNQRGRPEPPTPPAIPAPMIEQSGTPVTIEPHTVDVSDEMKSPVGGQQ